MKLSHLHEDYVSMLFRIQNESDLSLLSSCVCVSMWTESHKLWKVWALINQVFPRCFLSFGFWLNNSNRVKQVDISESTDIYQSISVNQFYPVEALIFIREFCCFPIIHHNSIFSTHMRKVCYSNNWKARHLCHSVLKLLMVV